MTMDHTGTAKRWLRGTAIMALCLTVTACEQLEGIELPAFLQGDSAESAPNSLAAAAQTTGETRDVEAPEVFQKSEAGLWDGRPSLGGVWVAHPDAEDPERVIIRNEDNGRFVTGALFRRERENPGPALQVSSDAAEELGMLAGSPANLSVVALRREEVTPAAPVIPETGPLDGTDVALAPPAAISSAPLDAAGEVADVAAPLAPAAAGSVGAIASAAADAAPVEAVDLPPLPAPAAPAASAAASSTIDAIAGAAAAVAAAEAEAGVAATDALPPLPGADATVGAPLDARGPIADPVALPEPVTSGLEKPFVQVGIFSVEGNANDAADTLRGDGISASVVEQDSGGTVFWRVLVGPAPTAQDRTAVLAKVQALGFNDAYFVSN